MPTTAQEADKVIELCCKHGVEPKGLLGLAKDLHEQVGQISDNWSVRETMRMLYDRALDIAIKHRPAGMDPEDFLASQGLKRPGPPELPSLTAWSLSSGWLVLWWFIVIGHTAVWVGLLASCVLTLVYQPLYISILAISFSIYILTTDTICPITRLENCVRRKLGWPEVGHFTHWYVICPLLHGRTCQHKCSPLRLGPS